MHPFGIELTTADWLGVVATVIAIIGIIIAIALDRRNRPKKAVAYVLCSSQSLETNAAYPGLRIEVSYQQEGLSEAKKRGFSELLALDHPHIWTYKIKNIGTRGLRKDDFETAITIRVTTGRIVDAYVKATSVPGVYDIGRIYPTADNPAHELGDASFKPHLMNPGDWLDIVVLTERESEPPAIDSWIFEQTKPMAEVLTFVSRRISPWWLVLPLAAVIFSLFFEVHVAGDLMTVVQSTMAVVALAVGINLILIGSNNFRVRGELRRRQQDGASQRQEIAGDGNMRRPNSLGRS